MIVKLIFLILLYGWLILVLISLIRQEFFRLRTAVVLDPRYGIFDPRVINMSDREFILYACIQEPSRFEQLRAQREELDICGKRKTNFNSPYTVFPNLQSAQADVSTLEEKND